MLKNMKTEIKKITSCIAYFARLVWQEKKIYYFYILLGIMVESIGPFITILGSKYLINEIAYENNRSINKIVFLIAVICVGTLLKNVIAKFANERQNLCNDYFERSVQKKLSNRTMKMKFQFTENAKMLDKIKRAERTFEETNLVQGIADGVVSIISSIIVLIGVMYLVISCSVLLLIPIIVSFIITTFVSFKTTKLEEDYYKLYSDQTRERDYYMTTLTEGQFAKDIRLYHADEMILTNQREVGERIFHDSKKFSGVKFKYTGVAAVVTQLCNTVIYLILAINAMSRKITVGDFSSLIQASLQFKTSMENISDGLFRLKYTTSILQYFIEFIDMIDEEETERNSSFKNVPNAGTKIKIDFVNVSFKYPGTDKYILKNVNATISDSEHISIVGENGAGKTTFIKLLCRLYEVTEGEILLNGININEYSYEDYVKMLAVVFQDYKLMAFNILQNITLKNSNSEDDRQVDELLKLVELDNWIESLDAKKETNLYKMFDEKGIEPSGGQAQKLAIVRALYKNAPIVILDEPTAALDPEAEYEIYNHFDKLVGGKTAIYISHRLSSCQFCDRILVFGDGTIVQNGSHEELIKNVSGLYYQMYSTQAKHYIN